MVKPPCWWDFYRPWLRPKTLDPSNNAQTKLMVAQNNVLITTSSSTKKWFQIHLESYRYDCCKFMLQYCRYHCQYDHKNSMFCYHVLDIYIYILHYNTCYHYSEHHYNHCQVIHTALHWWLLLLLLLLFIITITGRHCSYNHYYISTLDIIYIYMGKL